MIAPNILFCIAALIRGIPGLQNPTGYQNAAYFTNWGIYARDYQPHDIPAANLTQILYAFLNVKANGEIYSRDTYADIEKHFPANSWDETGHNTYGYMKQLYLLKKKHRHLKVILNIGGWTWSSNFPSAAATQKSREQFANTSVAIMTDWGFDGIDIDWEYPINGSQTADFVLLLHIVRQTLDAYAQRFAPNYHFKLSIISPTGPTHYKILHLKSMADIIDTFNLMGYNFSGSWGNMAGYQSNLFAGDPAATPFSIAAAVDNYLRTGIPKSKILLGMPFYRRAFERTNGIGQPFNGVSNGSWEKGMWDFKALPRPGTIEIIDLNNTISSYNYDIGLQELISYDIPEIVKRKVSWLTAMGLTSAIFWEANGNRADDRSLIQTSFTALGTMDKSDNLLCYPKSQYQNIKAGMVRNYSKEL